MVLVAMKEKLLRIVKTASTDVLTKKFKDYFDNESRENQTSDKLFEN